MRARKPLSRKIRVADLDFSKLFQPRPEEGRILFNARRFILLDVEALGVLRQQLLDTLGRELARGVLARFGYAHGYADAKRLGESFSWQSEADWLMAGPSFHILEGIVHATPEKIEFNRSSGHFHMLGTWRNSYEAELHLKLYGRSEQPVCWTLTGYASGYASGFFGAELLAIETECLGREDHQCRWEIRPEAAWGSEAEPYRKALKAVDVINQLRQMQLEGARFRDMALSSADWLWETDAQGCFTYCSEQVRKVLGYAPEQLVGKAVFDLMSPGEAARIKGIFEESVRRRQIIVDLEFRALTGDGEEVVQLLSGMPVAAREGEGLRVRGIARDITERRQAEEALKESRDRFRSLIETTSDWVWEVDEQGEYTYASPQVEKILGYKPEEVVGKKPFDFMAPGEKERLASIYQELAASQKPFSLLENLNLHKNGNRVLLETSGVPFFDVSDNFRGYRGIDRDISERRHAEEAIQFHLYHDLLTGLPNRAQLMLRLQLELVEASRRERKFAVVHLDLDRFKAINDSLGHALGDKVILAVAERLRVLVGDKDMLARIGSDEFILVVELQRTDDAVLLARRVVEAMRRVYAIDGHELYVTASVGISLYPEDGDNAESLLGNADVAVSHVKARGRDSVQFFNPAIKIRTIERLLLESSLRHTIERKELVLYYQPLVDIRSREVMCLEALVRWRHGDLGLLVPADFIPVAEEIGFITAIDEWVLKTACAQNRKWQKMGLPSLCMTVNISARMFQQPDLVEMVAAILREADLEPRYLDIEVTESTAMRDIDLAIPSLRGLRKLGLSISIDDFGTGYSSLNYLKRFPVQTLKIDQSFIRDLTTDPDDRAIVKAVIAMGHSLNLKVVAEGVETAAQHSFLLDNDCDQMQGFFFSRPVPPEQIAELVTGLQAAPIG